MDIFVMIMLIIVLLCVFARIIILVKSHIRAANELITHLEKMKDYKTLYELGFYNRYNQRETRRIMNKFEILMEKYEKTKDEFLLNYADFIETRQKKYFIYAFLIFADISIILFFLN